MHAERRETGEVKIETMTAGPGEALEVFKRAEVAWLAAQKRAFDSMYWVGGAAAIAAVYWIAVAGSYLGHTWGTSRTHLAGDAVVATIGLWIAHRVDRKRAEAHRKALHERVLAEENFAIALVEDGMVARWTIEAPLKAAGVPTGHVTHYKGGEYAVIGGLVSSTNGPTHGKLLVVYQDRETGKLYARDRDEFMAVVDPVTGLKRFEYTAFGDTHIAPGVVSPGTVRPIGEA